MGDIQPDRLKFLLLKADDDLAACQILPIWPEPVPISRPETCADEGLINDVTGCQLDMEMVKVRNGDLHAQFIPFVEPVHNLMGALRQICCEYESEAEGFLLSLISRPAGPAARLALALACPDRDAEGVVQPHKVTAQHSGRATHLIETYILLMARRTYAKASLLRDGLAARRLAGIVRE